MSANKGAGGTEGMNDAHEGRASFDTMVVHAGREVDVTTGAVAPPLHLSSTYARSADGELMGEHLYGRYGNPTRDRLERCLCALEGAADARALSRPFWTPGMNSFGTAPPTILFSKTNPLPGSPGSKTTLIRANCPEPPVCFLWV